MDANEARAALDQITQTQQDVAARSKAPAGYYAAVGLAQALFISAIVVPGMWKFALLIPGLLILGLTVAWYRSTVGTWAMGDIKGKGAWIFWIMVAATVAALATAYFTTSVLVGVLAGVGVFVVYAVLGPMWDRAYQRQVAERS